jgi:hypothetical protein
MLLSSDETSVDGVMKFTALAPLTEWYVLFAGDPSRFLRLMGTVRALLGDIKNKRLSVETVTSAFEAAYVVELVKLIEAEVLRPYGLPHEEFIRKGKDLLGEVRFNQVMVRVEALDLGVEVLVAGLDGWAQTQLFSVSPRGIVSPSVLPYHAIGSGAPVALGSLYPLAYFPTHELPETVYWACAAKFTAEITRSVGESTYAVVISPLHGTWTLVSEMDRLCELWKSKGRPPMPPEARRLIKRDLRKLDVDGSRAKREAG